VRNTVLDMPRKKKIFEPRRSVAYRLPERLLNALEAVADENRRSFTAQLEIAIETFLESVKRLPPKPPPPASERKGGRL
jgi:hypothetical protein